MTNVCEKERLEAIRKASIKQLDVIDIALEKDEISVIEAEFQTKAILDALELQATKPKPVCA